MAEESTRPAEPGRYRDLVGLSRAVQLVLLISIPILGILFIGGVHRRLGWSVFSEQWFGLFLALFLASTFLTFPARKKGARANKVPWYDAMLAGISTVPGLFLAFNYQNIVMHLGVASLERAILAGLLVLVTLEAIRRVLGWPLVIIAIVFLTYGWQASRFPGIFAGQDVRPESLLNYIYVNPSSILGMLAIAATIGVAFITFGQMLLQFGGGKALTDVALVSFGRYRGGTAKAAMLGSSLMGTVTGAPMSNVYLTGSVTIPMMIRSGYARATAGGIEAVASTGGQIMPPVMGIAAFIIADQLGIPYAEVALAALIPAVLFYLAVYVQVDLEAAKRSIHGAPRAELPVARKALPRGLIVVPPLGALIYTIFIAGISPATAAVWSTVITLPVFLILSENRQEFGKRVAGMLEKSGRLILDLAGVMVAAGIVVGVVSVTGLGFHLGYSVVTLAGGALFILLVIAALASLILGMGMPSVAAYALVAVLVAPALTAVGVDPLAAHLFIFYFAVVSNITPPIALAAFAAAPLAGATLMRTSVEAVRVGILIFIIPFLFVMSPEFLLRGEGVSIILTVVSAVGGTFFVGVAAAGYLTQRLGWLLRLAFLSAGFLVLFPWGGDYAAVLTGGGGLLGIFLVGGLSWGARRTEGVFATRVMATMLPGRRKVDL